MNRMGLVLAAAAAGFCIVPKVDAVVSLVNTNIVAAANEMSGDVWAIDDTTSIDYFIQSSIITAESGTNVELNAIPTRDQLLLGASILKSSSTEVHDVTVIDSEIIAGDGGSLSLDEVFRAEHRAFKSTGGNGMLLKNANTVLDGTTVSGGDIFATRASRASSVAGGYGITLSETSFLSAANSVVSGGDGGNINNLGDTGRADGGAGIVVSGGTAVLNLDNTGVSGGNAGVVAMRETGSRLNIQH